jgi:hypothetical protein
MVANPTALTRKGTRVRKWMIVVLVLFSAASAFAGLRGQSGGYVWAGVALLGLATSWYAGRARRGGRGGAPGLRLYSIVFAAALVVVAGVFAVLAITGGPEHQGAFVGLAILWAIMATGTVLLVVALERRLRKTPQNRH